MAEYKVIKVQEHQVKNNHYVGQYAIVASMTTQREPDSILGTVNLEVMDDMYIIARNIQHASEALNDHLSPRVSVKETAKEKLLAFKKFHAMQFLSADIDNAFEDHSDEMDLY